MTREKKKFRQLKWKDICHIYETLHKGGYVSFPVTRDAAHKVESLVGNINSSYFGKELYEAEEEKAAAYLYFLIKDHPFVDGNKRIACLSFSVVCDLNKLTPDYKDFSLDELAVSVEKSKFKDHQKAIRLIALTLFKKNDGKKI